MTGKMNLAVNVSKADTDILRVLDKKCYLTTKITVAADELILLDIEVFTNPNLMINREE